MSSDLDDIDQALEKHFKNITPEEFKKNLEIACPSLFDDSKQIIYEGKEIIQSTEDLLSDDNDAEFQEIDRILTEHFKNITPEEFKRNLEIACPSWIDSSPSISARQNNVDINQGSSAKRDTPYQTTQYSHATLDISLSSCMSSVDESTDQKKVKKINLLRTSSLIGGLVAAVALLGVIFIASKPSIYVNTNHSSTSSPIEVGDSLIYEYLQVSDKSGKKASINVVLLSSRYRWQIKQDKILQDSDDDKKSILIDKLSENLQRDGVYEVIKSNEGVSRVISVGTASCEGSTENEEIRAEKRALATNKFVVHKMFAVGQYSFINLGKFKKDDCKKPSPEKTSWQRALIILGVSQEEEGINITEAVKARLTKIPIDLNDYSLGENGKFQVRDIKSD